jgi:hypothetical protein
MRSLIIIVLFAGCGGSDNPSSSDAASADAADTTTAVTATMQATRVLDHAFFGANSDGTLHVELDKGGEGVCPTMSSPTPEYTLVLGLFDTFAMTSPATFLDYVGDMLGGPINASASTVTPSNIFYAPGTTLAFDLAATFDAGTVGGHVYAAHCASLDE